MIIWLASYPRSGNTFVRTLIKSCLGIDTYSKYNDVLDIGKDQNLAETVGHARYDSNWERFFSKAKNSREIYFIKTHEAPPDKSRAVYIVRDPRAALVSHHAYLMNYYNSKMSRADIISGATAFGSWGKHYDDWKPAQRRNTLFVHFEDLIKDPIKFATQIAELAKLPLKNRKIPTFQKLSSTDGHFFNKGSNKVNIAALSSEENNLIEFLFHKQMTECGYQLTRPPETEIALSSIEKITRSKWQVNQSFVRLEIENRQYAKKQQELEQDTAATKANLNNALANAKQANQKLAQLEIENRQYAKKQQELEQDAAATKANLNNAKADLDRERLAHEEDLKILSRMLDQHKTITLENQSKQAFIDELQTKIREDQNKIILLKSENETLTEQKKHLRTEFLAINKAVEPRLLTLLTMRSARFILAQRNRIKAGSLVLDEHGVPTHSTVQAAKPQTLPSLLTSEKLPINSPAAQPTRSIYADYKPKKRLGIAVYTFNRPHSVTQVLESLQLQSAMEDTHVWIDGDQGNPAKRRMLEKTFQSVAKFPVNTIHRNRGNYGFRKMMIVSMRKMFEHYERVLFIEDDCFPTRFAVKGFAAELDAIDHDPSIATVYGHPFLTGIEDHGPHHRFQGWGWASTRQKLTPLLNELRDWYLFSEDEYLVEIEKHLTDDLLAKLDVTPGRQPSSTLKKFFAWDEMLGFLAAKNGVRHQATKERLIYNCGVGDSSTHFSNIDQFRAPPFNMIEESEVWNKY